MKRGLSCVQCGQLGSSPSPLWRVPVLCVGVAAAHVCGVAVVYRCPYAAELVMLAVVVPAHRCLGSEVTARCVRQRVSESLRLNVWGVGC